jgi:peptidoglycan hydrolase-like protein with peptidoglycan-binding domain
MFTNSKTIRTSTLFVFLMTGMLALSLTPPASADGSRSDIKKAQQSLADKGYDPGPVDGVLGAQTRRAIGQYQKAEDLPVTEHLDAKTASRLGVEPESVGGTFKAAGLEVGEGGEQTGHEIKKGKPIAAGKELGKGIGRGGKKVGEGVQKAVSPESDRGDQEKKQ